MTKAGKRKAGKRSADKRLLTAMDEAVAIARGEAKPARMTVFVRTTWDPDAGVWTAGSPNLPGLVTEAATLEELGAKLPGLIADLCGVDQQVADADAGKLTEFDPTQAAFEMQMADATKIMERRSSALRELAQAAQKAHGAVWPAYWTHEAGGGEHLYYFAPVKCHPPPYRRQIKVEATIDVADDGTLAGIEFFTEDVPPPKR